MTTATTVVEFDGSDNAAADAALTALAPITSTTASIISWTIGSRVYVALRQ